MIWLINKIADHLTKISKPLQQNNLETITNEHDKEINKDIYIYIYIYICIYIRKTVDVLRLKEECTKENNID